MGKRSSNLQHKFSSVVTALAKVALEPAVAIDQLAARAHQAALLLQDEVAVPAAKAFKKDPTPANSDYGKRVARMVFDQHQAAEILDKIARARNEIEQKLNELKVDAATELARKTASSSSNNRADAQGKLAEEAAAEALAAVAAKPDTESSYAEAAEILAKAAQQGRLAAASSHAAASGSKASTADTADVDSESGRFEGEGGGGGLALAIAPKGIDQTDWARLPDNVKRQIRQSGSIESFSPEIQEAIRAYFKKLAQQ